MVMHDTAGSDTWHFASWPNRYGRPPIASTQAEWPGGDVVAAQSPAGKRSRSGSFAVITSILSLGIAMFGTGFTVLRATSEDQSKLRTELTETMRLLSAIDSRPTGVNERSAILAQIAQIIDRVHDVPSTYYRRLGQGLLASLRYSQAITALRQSIERAVSENSPLDQQAGHKALAEVYAAIGDTARMRKEYASATRVTSPDPPSLASTRFASAETLAQWAGAEARLGNCQLAQQRVDRSRRILGTVASFNRTDLARIIDEVGVGPIRACTSRRARTSGP
jgi:hypothetical protein